VVFVAGEAILEGVVATGNRSRSVFFVGSDDRRDVGVCLTNVMSHDVTPLARRGKWLAAWVLRQLL
jgi:hypothetical protein